MFAITINNPEIEKFLKDEFKNDENTSQIPFIFISAKSNQEDIHKGMNLGADDYIIKPFLLLDLIKIVETKLLVAN